jgi:hypothetical protein
VQASLLLLVFDGSTQLTYDQIVALHWSRFYSFLGGLRVEEQQQQLQKPVRDLDRMKSNLNDLNVFHDTLLKYPK